MWGFQQNFQWWMPFFGMAMMLFWIVVIGIVVWGVIRLTTGKAERTGTGDPPMGILRNRLAHGEITKEQFEELQESLQGSNKNA